MTCRVRVGRPRATVLRAVVCGPCWAAHGGSPDAGEIGPAPTTTVPSRDPRNQGHWLSALRRQDWVHQIRADGLANLLAVARLVALSASWQTLESRPTWERLVARSGLSERTVARWLQELRVRGWLAHLEHGSTPAHRPSVLAHLSGNRAAVYGLRIPLTPQEALHQAAEHLVAQLGDHLIAPALKLGPDAHFVPESSVSSARIPAESAPATPATVSADTSHSDHSDQPKPEIPGKTNGSPSWSGFSETNSFVGGFSRARKPVDNSVHNPSDAGKPQLTALRAGLDNRGGPDWATTVPTSRFAMLIAADWLRHRLPVFARCSRKLLRHLCKPYWHAGWTNRDIVHAMDHRPGLVRPIRRGADQSRAHCRPQGCHRLPPGRLAHPRWSDPARLLDITSYRCRRCPRHPAGGHSAPRPGRRRAAAKATLAAALATRHARRRPTPSTWLADQSTTSS